jgi:lysyl-tRNA synthetase class 1
VPGTKLSFGMLLNLASVCNTEDPAVLWGFISRYAPDATPEGDPFLDRLVGFAVRYYQDFVKPAKRYRAPGEAERKALADLAARLRNLPRDADGEAIQNEVYAVGKEHGYENLRDWFKALYEILLGQEEGPRIGSFMALYGLKESLALIDSVLQGQSAKASS